MSAYCGQRGMENSMSSEFYVVRREALPEVLLKVVEVNRLLALGKVSTVGEATRQVGISRSSYYKFKNCIEEFHDSLQGTTLTLLMEITDETGVLSDILKVIAQNKANILTIHQSIPMSGVASVSISIQILEGTGDASGLIEELNALNGVQRVRVSGRNGA
jgi:chorismate mutase